MGRGLGGSGVEGRGEVVAAHQNLPAGKIFSVNFFFLSILPPKLD